MSITKVSDNMRDTTTLDATKLSGATTWVDAINAIKARHPKP